MSFNKSKSGTTQTPCNSIIGRVLYLHSYYYRIVSCEYYENTFECSITLILMKDFFFQRSEEKDGEVSSNDIKTGDCLINAIEQVIFFLSKRSLSCHKHGL